MNCPLCRELVQTDHVEYDQRYPILDQILQEREEEAELANQISIIGIASTISELLQFS